MSLYGKIKQKNGFVHQYQTIEDKAFNDLFF